MSTPLNQRTKELVGKYIEQSHAEFEETECLNCIHYCDGCTSDYCPGHAVTK